MILPTIPAFIMTTPAVILRATTPRDSYGPQRDWANATQTSVNVCIWPNKEREPGSGIQTDRTVTDFFLIGFADLDLLATDRVRFNPGNGVITVEVDGDPFVWSGPPPGVPHHLEAKLKILKGA